MKKRSIQKLTTIKNYYRLTKPGIIRGNLITAGAGFLFAAYGDVDFLQLIATLIGIGMLIASACTFNNYIDRGIDSRMARTKTRALVTGSIPAKNALIFASLLCVIGFLLLAGFTNTISVFLGLLAILNYVVFYGLAKRRSVHGTLVGSISGALPITAGYTAVTGRLDSAAILLFLILVFWQMPHFYAIAMYRKSDYKSAGLPVLPIVSGNRHAKFQIMIYIVLFMAAVTMLTTLGYAGKTYLLVMTIFSGWWIWEAVRGFSAKNDTLWAGKMFSVSLIVLTTFSVMISVDYFLP